MNRVCASSVPPGNALCNSIPHTLASGYRVDSAPIPEPPFPSRWRNRFINMPPFKRVSIQRSTTHCTESTEEQGQPYPVLTSSLPASLIQRQQLCRWGLSHGNRQPPPPANFRKSEEKKLEFFSVGLGHNYDLYKPMLYLCS